MDAERWKRVDDLLQAALQVPAARQDEFLRQAFAGDAARIRALAAYKDFPTLWKDADPDIPILRQAKAEYAKLR